MSRGVTTQAVTHTVSGTVRDSDQYAIPGVVVQDAYGATATTGLDGSYMLEAREGANTLTATRSGYDIAPLNVNVVSNLTQVNFSAQVGCGSITVNGDVNPGMGGWDFLTTQWPEVNPGTDTFMFNTGPSSGRVGINPGIDLNVASTTSARSQVYHVPSDADAVILGVWIYQMVTGAGGEFDRQYVEILDEDDDVISQLYYSGLSVAAWTYLEFPMDTYIGDNIKIQFRTLNTGGLSYMTTWFDDVNLIICNTTCDDLMTNGGFESQDPDYLISGWLADVPQNYLPGYSPTIFHTGLWSMRTGIPTYAVAEDLLLDGFSEVYQTVDMRDPSPIHEIHYTEALLTFWLYTTRVEGIVPPPDGVPAGLAPERAVPTLSGLASRGPAVVNDTPEEDWIYVYVFDNNWNLLDRLVWEKATNTNTWVRYEFDATEYLGQRIKLLFGTYNDGRGGPSAMFVDDVVMGVCE